MMAFLMKSSEFASGFNFINKFLILSKSNMGFSLKNNSTSFSLNIIFFGDFIFTTLEIFLKIGFRVKCYDALPFLIHDLYDNFKSLIISILYLMF